MTIILSKRQQAINDLREHARTHHRDLFTRIQNAQIYTDFRHLTDPAHEDYGRRFNFFKGGRGGGRTTSISRCLVDIAADRPVRIAAARSFQNSIAESNKQSIEQQIQALGLERRFKVTEKYIESDNGSVFFFLGLERNVSSKKSLEGIDYLWAEECDGLSLKTIDTIEPTIRKDGSITIWSWNPTDKNAAIELACKQFAYDTAYRHTNYLDNPWCPQSLIKSAQALREHDLERYLHVYEGHYWSSGEASILGKRIKQYTFEVTEDYGTPLIGVDWGFAQDPTCVVECYVVGRRLFIRRAAGKVRLELPDTAAYLKTKVPAIAQYASRADSARPETISMVKTQLRLMQAAAKGQGSVEDGVEYLRSFSEIVIHPECQADTATELMGYSYKVDRNGDVSSVIVDASNHYADAIRYALEPLSRRKTSGWTSI
jgi:phage terminase large subunit